MSISDRAGPGSAGAPGEPGAQPGVPADSDAPQVDGGAAAGAQAGQPTDRHAPAVTAELTFPDLPQMELEELIGQLTDRAQNVLAAQGRLRALLRANAAVVSDLSLPVVLRHIASAARDLVQARYAALGVIGRDGALEEFVHVGMGSEMVQLIGDLPQGRGILGLLISHPEPVRLPDLAAHPAAVGFPAGHPPMGSFLGVPIRVRDQVFGNLYLTDSARGEFTAEDEQLVIALAASAAIAIENARLFQETEQQRHWLAASTELTQQLFAGQVGRPLELVLRFASQGAAADLATLIMVGPDGELQVEAALGAHGPQLTGQRVERAGTLAGRVIESGKPTLVWEYNREVGAPAALTGPVGGAMGVPLLAPDSGVLGALCVSRTPDRVRFTEADLGQLANFANHAGVALELDRARADRESLTILLDHDRIAADLHDHVIQELFAIGMGLEGMIGRLSRPEQRDRLAGYVESLDGTIRRIRGTIFQLHHAEQPGGGLRQRLLDILDQEAPALGFHAQIDFAGPVDLTIPAELADDVAAVVREAASNIAKHAHASSARVHLSVHDELVTIEVTDDGVGFGTPTRDSGMANLRRRAANHSGALEVISSPGAGTRIRWTAVLAPSGGT